MSWRRILAVLALNAGVVVAYETLLETTGLAQRSKAPKKALQSCIARLESKFGLRIVNHPGVGYSLDLDPDQVDVLLFARLCSEGRQSAETDAWDKVIELTGRARRLYRRRPFADIGSPSLETDWCPYIEGLWIQATADHFRACLHVGRHESVIPELESLTRRYPAEEIFWALLMLAQYRAGSRPASKRTYEAACDAIGKELNVDPGEIIQRVRVPIRSFAPAFEIPVP